MDLTYVDIPVEDNFKIRVFREQKMLHNVEDPRIGDNDLMYPGIKEPKAEEGDLGNYMLTDDVDPPIHVVPEYEPHRYGLCNLMVRVLILHLVQVFYSLHLMA
jgi:hypothetical protein